MARTDAVHRKLAHLFGQLEGQLDTPRRAESGEHLELRCVRFG